MGEFGGGVEEALAGAAGEVDLHDDGLILDELFEAADAIEEAAHDVFEAGAVGARALDGDGSGGGGGLGG